MRPNNSFKTSKGYHMGTLVMC